MQTVTIKLYNSIEERNNNVTTVSVPEVKKQKEEADISVQTFCVHIYLFIVLVNRNRTGFYR